MMAWARQQGLVTAGKKAWAIEFRILTNDDQPGPIASRRGTELWMRIASNHIWVDVQHAGMRFSYVMFKGASEPQYTRRDFDLPAPQLATFGTWIASVETRFRVRFRRNRMWVLSNIKGGRDALVAWIQNDFVRTASAPKPARRRRKA